jgi:GNAT superfamily N-acetyltransferase
MRYRLATRDDVPVLAQMRWEFRAEEAGPAGGTRLEFIEACSAFLSRALATDRWAIWVAEEEGQIVSHITLQVIEKVPKPGRLRNVYAYMTNVYTRPAFRNQGIGGRLLQEACRWAESAGMEFIIVWPSEEALSFYTRQGFRPVREALELPFFD